jgi:hypothetical protein
LIPTMAFAAVLALSGCSSSMGESSSPEPADMRGQVEPDFGAATPEEAARDSAVGGASDAAVSGPRQVITSGYMTVTVEEPAEAADEAARIVEQAGGHVDSRSEVAPTERDPGRAELTLRIPSDKLTATLDRIEGLGELEETTVAKQDVTSVAQDIDARITSLQTSVDRLLALMTQATTTADLIAIESALSERQANLESLQSQRRSLADQVDMSTVTLYLGSERDAPIDEPFNFWSGLQAGWEALMAFGSFLLVALGVILPWLILPVIALAVVWLLVRRRRRRRAAQRVE